MRRYVEATGGKTVVIQLNSKSAAKIVLLYHNKDFRGAIVEARLMPETTVAQVRTWVQSTTIASAPTPLLMMQQQHPQVYTLCSNCYTLSRSMTDSHTTNVQIAYPVTTTGTPAALIQQQHQQPAYVQFRV